jgi:hypothetical protein
MAQRASSTPTPPPLNTIRIGHCKLPTSNGNPKTLEDVINDERQRGLVLDARPFAVNQSTGQMRFDGKAGRVSVVNMNPFVYRYDISVAQEELVSSAVSDFIDILLPEALRSIGKAEANKMRVAEKERNEEAVLSELDALEARLNTFVEKPCTTTDNHGCDALKTMSAEFVEIKKALESEKIFASITGPIPTQITDGTKAINDLRDKQLDAYATCTQAGAVKTALARYNPDGKIDDLEGVQKRLENLISLASDLSNLVDQYFADDELKTYTERCGGFNCARQFKIYADKVLDLLNTEYQPTLENRLQSWRQFQALLKLMKQMEEKDGLFARTFEIKKKFELSAATISIARVEVKPADEPTRTTARAPSPPKSDSPAQHGNENPAEEGENDKKKAKAKDDKQEDPEKLKTVTPNINESIQIGRPRFLVSGGFVYSPLPRQTFETATGFTRDAQGNPTGDGNTKIVRFGENSPRRLLPMVFLNSRIASFSPASIYFSLGVTAKKDKDIDVEYLLGPSVSMLNDRAMFTFGAYAGKGQKLVPEVKVGDALPDDAGDALLATKRYTWKPGFSFSYVFSNVTKRSQEGGGDTGGKGGSASVADDLKDEIRIGSIPFNLAMGLAYTSLEDQTFAPILGFARDRQGNLTNGQTLTRIVGLSTSSSYRLVPLAMLHSRLINFGRYSFYLTSGVTGKKDDDKVEIEYLLGGSVNLYRRKLFFTFGSFAGKQQVLAGDLFVGGKLNSDQNPGIERRYVWKPAFAFSYDISKIIPAASRN